MARKLLAMLICACVLTGAPSCSKQDGIVNPSPDASVEESSNNDIAMQTPPTPTHPSAPEENPHVVNFTDTEAENLRKLCKVWGFVKYTHPAFLSREKDWDEELLALIPTIQSASEDEVNDILYDWFLSLGDDGYGGHSSSYDEQRIRTMTDMTWIADESYLGAPLSSVLARFQEIPNSYASETLFYYNGGRGTFRNEKQYPDLYINTADTVETGYRLLGLFRLWNAIEYYFPYKDIMDESWNELLIEFIPKMMEGTNYQSYCLTLFALGAKTQDAHVTFSSQVRIMISRFGNYAIPASLEFCEGQIVIQNTFEMVYPSTLTLHPGDVIAKIDGVDIGDIIAERIEFIAVPNEDKIRDVMLYLPLCTNRWATVTVLRDGVELSGSVFTFGSFSEYYTYLDSESIENSHDLLEGNIGLINPTRLSADNVHTVMAEFSSTSGLIIDLRQRPNMIAYLMAEYLLNEIKQFALMSRPLLTVPGLHIDDSCNSAGPGIRLWGAGTSRYPYFYDKPVVILMNQHSQSHTEFTIMALRIGPNVTVIGSNSIGTDGNVASLLLPCGNTVTFTSMGVYTPEGGQTQRIGLSPDIYVEPTIEGIRDGRDELMEAAVAFLLGQ